MRLGAQALDLMLACAEGRLAEAQVNWAEDHALTVVMAAKGYPGALCQGLGRSAGWRRCPRTASRWCFTPAPAERDGQIIANGGRVLNVTARGATLAEAQRGPMRWSTGSTGPTASAAAISAGARL